MVQQISHFRQSLLSNPFNANYYSSPNYDPPNNNACEDLSCGILYLLPNGNLKTCTNR